MKAFLGTCIYVEKVDDFVSEESGEWRDSARFSSLENSGSDV